MKTSFAAPLLLAIYLGVAPVDGAADPRFVPPDSDPPRYFAFISDLHMSLGQVDGQWHPYEDFRWPNALRGLLDELSRQGDNRVDLIIVGDFLELWQLPDDITCRGQGGDLGCSIDEMVALTRRVISGHARTFSDLAAFSAQGDNRLYLIPGNHDAALLVPEVWSEVAEALGAGFGHVKLVDGGLWSSPDGRILVEHGHQIGRDANRYDEWPNIVDPRTGLIVRPWGELFVQKIFNETEMDYPIIDNLSPETAGLRYHLADPALWGGLSASIARFIAFNLFETSLAQKAQFLGPEPQLTNLLRGMYHMLGEN